MFMCCSFDNAEVYAGGKAEEVMGQAIKVCQLIMTPAHTPQVLLHLRVFVTQMVETHLKSVVLPAIVQRVHNDISSMATFLTCICTFSSIGRTPTSQCGA